MPTKEAITRDELSLYSQRLRALEVDLAIVKTLAETVTGMSHVMFGNGSPGLPEQVRSAKEDIKNLETAIKEFIAVHNEKLKERADNLRWWNRFIIGALLLNIIVPIAMRFAFP